MEGEAKMSELLKKDITIKVISVLFALALWIVVNPVTTRELTVPLSIINETSLKGKSLELKSRNFARTIQVRVRGKEDSLNKLSENDFEAILDFADIDSSSDKILKIEGPFYKGKDHGIKIESFWPREISIDLERIVSQTFAVEIEPPKGELKPGYKVTNIVAKPDKVNFNEVESLIKQIGTVKASIDITGLSESTTIVKNCVVYDKNGKEITQLSKNCSIELYVEISKEVPIIPVKKDELPSDHVGGITKVVPDKALVTGNAEVLESITEIRTEPVSLKDITRTSEISAALIVPEGAKLVNTSKNVLVSITVEPIISREITVGKDEISLINKDVTLEYVVQTENLNINVRGLRTALAYVTAATLRPTVNVAGLGEGTHKLPVDVYVPGNVELLGNYAIDVRVVKVPEMQ